MSKTEKSLRTCKKGHQYYKSSDCPTCPDCEKEKVKKGFIFYLSAPAGRALEHEGIITLEKLSTYTKKEILNLHGLGPASIPTLEKLLKEKNLNFKS